MARSSRKGHIRLSLVSIPVKAFTANVAQAEDAARGKKKVAKSSSKRKKTEQKKTG